MLYQKARFTILADLLRNYLQIHKVNVNWTLQLLGTTLRSTVHQTSAQMTWHTRLFVRSPD